MKNDMRFEQEDAFGDVTLVIRRLTKEREPALDLSAEVGRLAADPEFIALFLVAGAELLELGERVGREFEHFDCD